MRRLGAAGVLPLGRAGGFAPATERVIGNGPEWTGSTGNNQVKAGPHPRTQPLGGQVGNYDGFSGADPRSPGGQLPANPRVDVNGAEQENARRFGIQGFNDQLQTRDRHVYWSRGHARNFGGRHTGGSRNPNLDGEAMPTLRAVNISTNPQIGSDNSRNQDDLTRPYTWLGQQDGTAQPVYGGVPGLWASYGNRGRPSGIHDPSNGQGGPALVYSGPPHGLHSDTYPPGKLVRDRYRTIAPPPAGRFDRPSNSRAAGQSYSQTVQPQGAQGRSGRAARSSGVSVNLRVGGRGWAGK